MVNLFAYVFWHELGITRDNIINVWVSCGIYIMGSGTRACGLLVIRDLGQGAERVNIKLAQLINVKQAELGQHIEGTQSCWLFSSLFFLMMVP